MVRLVVEHDGFAPGTLLATPVGELGGDDGVDVGADLRVTEQLDGSGAIEGLLQGRGFHASLRTGLDARTTYHQGT